MTIGKVAEKGGVNSQTVRYYEREGLQPKTQRMSSGYRLFTDDTVRRVRFIKRAQELGLRLTEIRELLSLRIDEERPSSEARSLALARLPKSNNGFGRALRNETGVRPSYGSVHRASERMPDSRKSRFGGVPSMNILHSLEHALLMALTMGWEILWALILGFFLSAVIQAVVSKEEMSRLLPDDKPRTIAIASGLGMASSSCSYAAVALARSMFRKGANFIAAMGFSSRRPAWS